MRIIAYSYREPLLASVPETAEWPKDVAQRYQDWGDRQQWQLLLEDCRSHPQTQVAVRNLQELGADLKEVSDRLQALAETNTTLVLSDQPPVQPAEQAALLAQAQTLQQAQRGQRIQQGHARSRVKALPPPGKAPYGYRRGRDRYTLDRATAPLVKEFFDHFLLYGSLRGSVRYLNKKYGKAVAISTARRWLTNPVYRGDLAYHTGEVVPDTHPPILSRQEAAQVDRLLRRNRQLSPRTASAPRSLAGLVMCSSCQSPLHITQVSAPRQPQTYCYLRPASCPQQPKCRAIAYDAALNATIQRICEDLPRAVAGVPLPDVEQVKQGLMAQVNARQQILTQLPDLLERGVLDQTTADLRAYTLRTEMATLQAQLAALPPISLTAIAQVASLPQFWLDLSESERRFYFREFLRQIQLERQGCDWQVRLSFMF